MIGGIYSAAAVHAALVAWHASAAKHTAARTVVAAASSIPALREAAESIARTGGRSADWKTVADTDPYATWPAIAAVAQSATTNIGLVFGREMVPLRDRTMIAWSLDRARVTWRDGCLAVGAPPASIDGMYRYVDDLGVNNVGAALSWLDTPVPDHSGETVGIFAEQHSLTNYYHWLTGALRAAMLLENSGVLADLDRLIILMPRGSPPFADESLSTLGLDRTVVDVCTTPIDVSFDRVVIPTRVHLDMTLPFDAYARLLQRRLGVADAPRTRRRRLLISRADARTRRVTNEQDLEDSLRASGFEVITPGALTFAEQVETFSGAEFVVAPHGAALANLLFCSPGTRVLEFRDQADDRPWFEIIAQHAALEYRALCCPSDPAFGDLLVDVEAVTRLVETWLR
jgi:hypothetical protein